MKNRLGAAVPEKAAVEGIALYRAEMKGKPYYRESITYTIDELEDLLQRARKEMQKMGVKPDQQCVSFLPYISAKDKRLDFLFVPAVFNPASQNANGPVKHRFNKKLSALNEGQGEKDGGEGGNDPDPDNPYNGFPEPSEEGYNSGMGRP